MKQFLLSILFTVACLVPNLALAQGSTTAAISGIVRDAQGQTLPGATVIAVHVPTGTQYGAVTNADGFFRILNMRVGGPYTVRFSFVGYEPMVKEDLSLSLGQTYSVDAALREETEQLEEVVVTAAQNRIIDGDRTGAQTVVDEQAITSMPTASRNLVDFLRLTPQANIGETADGPNISIAGQNNRFNSLFIDGLVNNDVFGLSGSGTNGGQTGVSPISVDAIEQFSVAVSPFDVTLGGFTGGGINAVTRSGSNNFEGSAYYFFRNESLAGKTPTEDPDVERVRLNDFTARTYGARLGGPIIKDKLFFFTNVEIQRDEESQPTNLSQYRGTVFGNPEFLDQLSNFVQENYQYNVGDWRDNKLQRSGDKVLLKLDWNLNQNQRFTLRHNYAYAEETERDQSGNNEINFSNNAEFLASVTNSTAFEWRGNFGDNLSNKLIIGYTRVRDDRDIVGSPFPRVTIGDGRNGRVVIGSEPFSIGNQLTQDVVTLTNNLNLFAGKHTFTFGTHNEFYDVYNLFLRENYGSYTFDDAENFAIFNDAGDITGIDFQELFATGTERYVRSYALVPGVDAQLGDNATGVAANFSAAQLGFYVQDEYQMTSRLKLNAGIRLDIPFFMDNPVANPLFNEDVLPQVDKYYDLEGARSGQVPDRQYLFSPRFGFNWDVYGDRKYQLRGGMGIFTGRIPFVWPGGSFTNNGVFIASIQARQGDFPGGVLPFRPDVNNQYIGSDFGLQGNPSQIDLFAKDFKYPQVLRTSLAGDVSLPGGIIGTLEGVYTKNLNQVYYQNINLLPANVVLGQFVDASGNIQVSGPDNRPIYGAGQIVNPTTGEVRWGRVQNVVDPRFDRVLLGKNTNAGYAVNLTASLTKPFNNGIITNVAYTWGRSRVLIDATSSQNSSNWRNQEVIDRNDPQVGFSDFDPGHRVTAFTSYRLDWSKFGANFGATTISLFYNGQSGNPFSYTYGRGPSSLFGVTGDRGINGDDEAGRAFNNLIFVPASPDQINLVDLKDRDGNVIATAAEQWEALNTFIESNDYLSDRRGQYAEMNGGRLPFQNILDLKFMQDFSVMVGGKKNTLQLSLDIFNFTNLLSQDWGRRRFLQFGTISPINFEGYQDPANGDFRPRFTFNPETKSPKEQAALDDTGIYSSRWHAQVGVRYIFGN